MKLFNSELSASCRIILSLYLVATNLHTTAKVLPVVKWLNIRRFFAVSRLLKIKRLFCTTSHAYRDNRPLVQKLQAHTEERKERDI